MKAKMLFAALLGSLLSGTAIWAQPPAPVNPLAPGTVGAGAAPFSSRIGDEAARNVIAEPPPQVSEYVAGRRNICCDTPYCDPAIGTELYLRPGLSIPFGGQRLTRNTSLGYILQGGAQTLFYNPTYTKAWYVDGNVGIQHNSGVPQADRDTFLLDIIQPNAAGVGTFFRGVPVTIRSVDRTYVSLGAGREWWLWGSADQATTNLRFAIDGGGRYGFMTMGLNEIRHRTDVIGGTYLGAELIYEVPCEQSSFRLGLRGEWAYTWSDILQRATDIQEANIYMTIGVRY